MSACNAGDLGSIPGLGRSPGEGNGNPLQYSCLENPMDGGAWWATVHGVPKSWTRLSDFTFILLGRKTPFPFNLFPELAPRRLSLKSRECIRAEKELSFPREKGEECQLRKISQTGQVFLREKSGIISVSHLQQAGAEIISPKSERLCLAWAS